MVAQAGAHHRLILAKKIIAAISVIVALIIARQLGLAYACSNHKISASTGALSSIVDRVKNRLKCTLALIESFKKIAEQNSCFMRN